VVYAKDVDIMGFNNSCVFTRKNERKLYFNLLIVRNVV